MLYCEGDCLLGRTRSHQFVKIVFLCIIIGKDNNIYYRILKTTFYEGGPEEITRLHTEALGVLFPVDNMDSCEEMMIQDWPGSLYMKDDTAFLCWTYSPEVTYVLEYTPSKIDDS